MTSILHGRAAYRRRHPLLWTAGLLAVAVFLSACAGRNTTPSTGEILTQYLPSDWSPVASVEGPQEINIDETGPNKEAGEEDQPEWLVFFHYDSLPGQSNGPIGGIIYDAQQGTEVYNPAVTIPFPFQPAAFFVPYRLLPDWVEGKGQGYLGDIDVTWEPTTLQRGEKESDELLVLGQGPGGVVTRISIFRWLGKAKGYGVWYFQGSYSATILGDRKEGEAVRQVQTLNALNDRSKLCENIEWTRQGDTPSFTASQPAIVFCLNAVPQEPTYPEAVVLAYTLAPTASLVLSDTVSWTEPMRVVTLSYPGTATVIGTGADAKSTMTVTTVLANEQGQTTGTYAWKLEEQRPTPTNKTTRWRIVSVNSVP